MKETFKAFDQARSEGWFIGHTFKIIFFHKTRFLSPQASIFGTLPTS